MHFEIFKSGDQYRWRLMATGIGKKPMNIANSGEAYHNYFDCVDEVRKIKGSAAITPIINNTNEEHKRRGLRNPFKKS